MRYALFVMAACGALFANASAGQQQSAQSITPADLKPLEEIRKAAISAFGLQNVPELDLELIAQEVNALRVSPYNANAWAKGEMPSFADIQLTAQDMAEIMDVGAKASAVLVRVSQRASRHAKSLAARGIAEVPPSTAACRFKMSTSGGSFLFDRWGDLHIDRRFVDAADLPVIRQLESLYRRIIKRSPYAKTPKDPAHKILSRSEEHKSRELPVFRGFEDERYQMHDDLILEMTADFNANKSAWAGGTPAQAAKIPSLSPALVKSHMIEESGGNGPASLLAWRVDPLQVNVPGDWDDAKLDIGLKKPSHRNEGTLAGNVRAAIMFLARKGFGSSGKAARVRPKGYFDGWPDALRRYNARRDRTADGRHYSDAYSSKITMRAANPDVFVPIEIKLAK